MNKEQAAQLRAAFDPALIEQLPKAGVKLDYISHATTTDRLLQVDPDWTWRPFTVEERASVCASPEDLWIWLTICGVTRPGVGDGKSTKERIGDAIRNGAMRFGVALDLWAKVDLDASGDAALPAEPARASSKAPAPASTGAAVEPVVDPPPAPVPVAEPEPAVFVKPPSTEKKATKAQKDALTKIVGDLILAGRIRKEQVEASAGGLWPDVLELMPASEVVLLTERLVRFRSNAEETAA